MMRGVDTARLSLSLPRGVLAGLAVLAALTPGCSREPEDAVISMKGWSMTLPEVRQEYDRVHQRDRGPDAWTQASLEEKEAFVRTLADKELLLREARRVHPKLEGKFARIYRITYEKNIQRDFLRYLREEYKLTPEELSDQLPKVSREAQVRVFVVTDRTLIPSLEADLEAGSSFEDLAKKYGMRDPMAPPGDTRDPWVERTIRVDQPAPAPLLYLHALLRDRAPGEITRPFQTNSGSIVLQVLGYKPVENADSPAFRAQAEEVLESIGYMSFFQSWSDSLKAASEVAFHKETYPILAERFAAFWDSIGAAREQGESIDYQAFEGPTSVFSRDQLELPVYDLWGKTWTVADFVRSLDDIDLDQWPTVGPEEKLEFQIDSRIYRLLFQTQAEKTGFDKTPEFSDKMARVAEEQFLDQYYDGLGGPDLELTPEQIQAEYDKNPTGYRSADLVAFSVLTYPPGQAPKARATLGRLRDGDASLLWYDLAPAEQARDSAIVYTPPTAPMDVTRPAPVPAWSPYLEAARDLETGKVSDLVETGHGISIVFCVERRPARVLPLEEARHLVIPQARRAKKEEMIQERLDQLRERAGIVVHLDRLQGELPS